MSFSSNALALCADVFMCVPFACRPVVGTHTRNQAELGALGTRLRSRDSSCCVVRERCACRTRADAAVACRLDDDAEVKEGHEVVDDSDQDQSPYEELDRIVDRDKIEVTNPFDVLVLDDGAAADDWPPAGSRRGRTARADGGQKQVCGRAA